MTDRTEQPRFLEGGGEVGALIRAFDWTRTPLGGPQAWPEALKTLASVMLSSSQPMFTAWGPERTMLYNDGYAALMRDRHPAGLGAPFAAVWRDIMHDIGPILERAFAGEPTQMDDIALELTRDGRPQEAHFSFSYTPVRGPDGTVAGLFCACQEITARVLATRGATAERERIRRMLQQMPGFAALLAGPEHRYEYVNDAYVAISGPRDFIGRRVRDVFPEVEGQGYFERLDEVYATGLPYVARGSPIRLSGEERTRFIDVMFEPVRDDAGRVAGIFIGGYETTDAVRALGALRESEARFRNVADHAPIMMWVTDAAGRCAYLNRAWYVFTGQTEAEALGHGWLDATHPDDRAEAERIFRQANSRAEPFRLEYRLRRADGAYRWAIDAASPRFGDKGEGFLGYVGSVIDIDERRGAERELERRVAEALAERRLLAEMVERTPIFIQVVGLDWRLLAINRATADEFERHYGVRPAVGDDVRTIIADQPRRQAAMTGLWTRAIGGEEFIETAEFGGPPRRTYEMRFHALRDAEGRQAAAYMFATDVTERLADQRQLHEMQKMEMIGQLTGGVAHDFNNLLSAILSNLDLARRRIDDLRVAKLVDGAIKGAERGAALTKRLLAFARRQDLKAEPVSVPALVEGMRELLERTLGPGIRIEASFPAGLPMVEADPNQLELALLNLAVNARDAMPGGGTLSISAADESEAEAVPSRASGLVRIVVADTGAGMDAETLRRAVEPFFTTKGVGKGTGLGLSMVQGLAAQSGGSLELRSQPGRGTTVALRLPRAEGADAPQAPRGAVAGPAPPRPLKVLVVDDDMLVGMGTAAMLEDLGHAVLEAPSGRAALDLHAEHGDIDVVVTDHSMPGMTGTELAAALAARDPALPIILATGYADLPGGGASALPRLTKPFRQEELAAAIGRAVGRSGARTPV
jgi:PAS domain S-box-containing protein